MEPRNSIACALVALFVCACSPDNSRPARQVEEGQAESIVLACRGTVVVDGGRAGDSEIVLRLNLANTNPAIWRDFRQRPLVVEEHSCTPNAVIPLINTCIDATCQVSITDSRITMELDQPDALLIGRKTFRLSRITGEYTAANHYRDVELDGRPRPMVSIVEEGRCEPARQRF